MSPLSPAAAAASGDSARLFRIPPGAAEAGYLHVARARVLSHKSRPTSFPGFLPGIRPIIEYRREREREGNAAVEVESSRTNMKFREEEMRK